MGGVGRQAAANKDDEDLSDYDDDDSEFVRKIEHSDKTKTYVLEIWSTICEFSDDHPKPSLGKLSHLVETRQPLSDRYKLDIDSMISVEDFQTLYRCLGPSGNV